MIELTYFQAYLLSVAFVYLGIVTVLDTDGIFHSIKRPFSLLLSSLLWPLEFIFVGLRGLYYVSIELPLQKMQKYRNKYQNGSKKDKHKGPEV